MNKRTLIGIAAAALVAVAACGWDQDSRLSAKTADYPCGTAGVVCATQHSCCWQGSTCGGEPASVGCPAGQCCEVGSYGVALDSDGGLAPRMHPQVK